MTAGLCCAALLAKYGFRVTVCESHYHAGGAAHGFEVQLSTQPCMLRAMWMVKGKSAWWAGEKTGVSILQCSYALMQVRGYHFDSGPSFFAGLSGKHLCLCALHSSCLIRDSVLSKLDSLNRASLPDLTCMYVLQDTRPGRPRARDSDRVLPGPTGCFSMSAADA